MKSKVLQLMLGFFGSLLITSFLGLSVTWWIGNVTPELFARWAELGWPQKATIAVSLDCFFLITSLFLWKKKRFLSLGVGAFLACDLILSLINMLA
jgi:hypothetical protein